MASGTATFAAAGEILKDDYQPVIREELNDTFMLLAQIESNSDDIEGTEAVVAIHSGRNPGVGARGESGSGNATLPTAGHQDVSNLRIPLKYNYGRFAVSGPIIEASASNRGSFDRIVEFNSKRLVVDLRRDVNRQLYTPQTGIFATVQASPAPSTTSFAVEDETAALYFEIGNSYAMFQGATSTLRNASFTVTDVNEDTNVITMNTATLPVAGDVIVRLGVTPSGAAPTANTAELHGLTELVDSTGTVHGLAPTGVWKSYEEAVSAAPSDAVFQRAMDRVHVRSGTDINLIIGSFAGVRAYGATLTGQKRYTGDQVTRLKGGFDALTVNAGRGDVKLVAERDCPEATMFGLNTDCWTQYEMSDWSFMDRDGSVFQRVANEDAYEATLYKYHELMTDARNKNFKLTALTV